MWDGLDLEPNRPRRVIWVFDLKKLHYFQIAPSSKKALGTLPVVM